MRTSPSEADHRPLVVAFLSFRREFIIVGAILAFIMVRTDLPGRKWLETPILIPIFVSPVVLGFAVMVILTSFEVFGPAGIKGGPPASATIKMLRDWMQWIFGFGLVGLGAYIDFKELANTGGAPFKVGIIVGATKYVLALLVVLMIKNYLIAI